MSDRRHEILRATAEAARIAAAFPRGSRTSFDVVGAVVSLGIPLMFRPLKGLLGATLRVDNDLRGILVTTSRDFHVQRFTLAHELGHLLLGHHTHLDIDVHVEGRHSPASRGTTEIAADTFASELLAPKSLIKQASVAQGWRRTDLSTPDVVYQLGLRLGISYEAACWALVGQELVSTQEGAALRDVAPKQLKTSLTDGPLENPWADVWRLSARDSGAVIEASRDDVFVLALVENPSAGYLWTLAEPAHNVTILNDENKQGDRYGGGVSRRLTLKFNEGGAQQLTFRHMRPWTGESLEKVDFLLDTRGKEQPGLPRLARESLVGSAS